MENKLQSVEDVLREIEAISPFIHSSRTGISHERTEKIRAIKSQNELHQIYHLVESHVSSLREKTAMSFERILSAKDNMNEELSNELKFLKNVITTKCLSNIEDDIAEIVKQVEEMPKEWTIIQITSQFNSLEIQNVDSNKYYTNPLHLSVFSCGRKDTKPFMVTVDVPKHCSKKMDLVQELMDFHSKFKAQLANLFGLTKFRSYAEKKSYYAKRYELDQSLKELIENVENNWLREWRCLLIGKYQDENIEKMLEEELENFFKNRLELRLSQRQQLLIHQITKGIRFLSAKEIHSAVQYCFSNMENPDTIKEICQYLTELDFNINTKYEKLLRHPIILVLDECLDKIPWEMMEILKDEPATRVPSLHFVYFLFKAHEKDIEDGHKVIRDFTNGSYIVNPDRNLDSMENRMTSFFQYWLPKWQGISDRKPTSDDFSSLLTKAEIFSYNGHGSGAHIMHPETLKKTRVNAVVLLFGCSSTKVALLGPQAQYYGHYYAYLMARCPCVLGMLFEVTDIDTDILTTEFLSNWIPSEAPIPWTNVEKTKWLKGTKTDTFVAAHKAEGPISTEPELLRALRQSKKYSVYFLTRAAVVVRGLPVKIKLN